jgi:hypothetical protein
MQGNPADAQETRAGIAVNSVTILVIRSINDYPAGLIGTVSALFGRTIAASHGVDWTLDAMIAEEQSKFFRQFDPGRDRAWVAMENDSPRGALTIEGPRPENGQGDARLRFFILDESLRGKGLRRSMMAEACTTAKNDATRECFSPRCPD